MIERTESLTDHGNERARRDLLAIAERSLERVHPSNTVAAHVRRDGDRLVVDGEEYDLTSIDGVSVIGAGKGSVAVVEALQAALDRDVSAGIVAEKAGQERPLPGVDVVGSGHPIPDETGLEAGRRAREIADRAGSDDLVFVCITGGASAQLVSPPPAVPLVALAETTDRLLRAGLPIDEINAVRKHLSRIKGGRLAERLAPATAVTLVVVDEVAGEPWGPTVADGSTAADAVDALKRRGLWAEIPDPVRTYLRRPEGSASVAPPSPDRIGALPAQYVVLANAATLCEAAAEEAAALGYDDLILSTGVEGESRDVGTALASVAVEAATYDRPAPTPCVLVSGGETTVTVPDDAGEGGPNQEFALSVALELADRESVTALALGTDGTDGPTDVAGGLVDGTTVPRLRERGVDPFTHLRRHDSSVPLRRANDAVYTGETGTNLMDLRLFLVTE
ncbi:glycerate kinase type-2 family protein [Halorarum salinum]|uniref:DUF4147 domain-containing protein n=1 Tax=Halorarum salinum TaxID=2743089 RepID=A0A7D5QAT3_9EURY|nr:DUF4147 domain-containing protein [Halobaculum salinum]QLG61719.1 DUF4147 domain-containing protein [Halobaculum salinum]